MGLGKASPLTRPRRTRTRTIAAGTMSAPNRSTTWRLALLSPELPSPLSFPGGPSAPPVGLQGCSGVPMLSSASWALVRNRALSRNLHCSNIFNTTAGAPQWPFSSGSAVPGYCTEAGVQQEVYRLLCRAPPEQHALTLSSGYSVLQRLVCYSRRLTVALTLKVDYRLRVLRLSCVCPELHLLCWGGISALFSLLSI